MLLDGPQALHFLFELRQLFLEPRLRQHHSLRRILTCGRLPVGGFDLAQIPRHTLLDLLQPPLQLALREVVVAAVRL